MAAGRCLRVSRTIARLSRCVPGVLCITVCGAALAHETATHAAHPRVSAEERSFGREGDRNKVSRTISMEMSDAMRFSPSTLQVKRGDTVRFELTNSGKLRHEMVLGTLEELKKHAASMRDSPGMAHDQPYMTHVAPGEKGTLVWQFTKTGEFYYGCLVPGHFEAGMMGRIVVR